MSSIIALVWVSLSELQTIDQKYNEEWVDSSEKELLDILYSLGMNTNQPVERSMVEHRNRFGNLITCSRWTGLERLDKEWIESGYASEEAIAKSLNNGLVNDLFRLRGLTE